MAAFVDRVIVHVAAGNGGPRGLLGAPREVQAARRPRRGQRRRRRRRRPRGRPQRAHAAGLPPPPAPEGRQRQARARAATGTAPAARTRSCACRPAPSSAPPTAAVIADLVGAGTRVVLAARRQGRPRQRRAGQLPPQGPRLRAARRARRGRRRRHRAQEHRRRRPGRLPVGGQVLAGRGDVRGPAEDRRLPVHHAGAQPRRDPLRRHRLHDGRRPGPDPRRLHRQGPGRAVPAARRALRRPGARRRHGHDGARPRPGERHRGPRARAAPSTAATSSTWSAGCGSPSSTRSTCPTPASWSTWCAPRWRSAASRSSRSARRPARG